MQQEMRITGKSIKDKLMITRKGCRAVSLVMVLLLVQVGCINSNLKKQAEPNLTFVDTLVHYVGGERLRREIGMMKDSLKQGLWISFYPDGKINSIEFFDKGEWNGPWYYFYENGQILAYRGTKNGGFHGEGYNYFENGILMSKLNFADDKPDGIFEHFHENGEAWYAIEYKDGKYVRTVYGNPPIMEE